MALLLWGTSARAAHPFEARVTIEGTRAEKKYLRDCMQTMLSSPEADRRARALAARGRDFILRFGVVEDALAWTRPSTGTLVVEVMPEVEKKTASWAAGLLAHELLGHADAMARASQAKLAGPIHFWEGDEMRAIVLGRLVRIEVGGLKDAVRQLDVYDDDVVFSSETWRRETMWFARTRALGLSREELRDAAAAWQKRLAAGRWTRHHHDVKRREFAVWRYWFDHFVSSHGVTPDMLKAARDDLAGSEEEYATWESSSQAHMTVVEDMARWYGSPEGREDAAQAAELGRSSVLAALESDLESLSIKLRAVMRPPALPEAPAAPVGAAALGWPELIRRLDADRLAHRAVAAGEPAPLAEEPEP